jgi:hypothetical protein
MASEPTVSLLSDDERVVQCGVVTNVGTVTCHKGQMSFKEFRIAIHPKMEWNWMVELITHELQLFYNAFVEGKRPKLAIEMPPQHGKSWSAEDSLRGLPASSALGRPSTRLTVIALPSHLSRLYHRAEPASGYSASNRRAKSAVEKFAHDRAARTMPAPTARRPRPLRGRRSAA